MTARSKSRVQAGARKKHWQTEPPRYGRTLQQLAEHKRMSVQSVCSTCLFSQHNHKSWVASHMKSTRMYVETRVNDKKQASSSRRQLPTATFSPLCVFIFLASPILFYFFTSLAFISLIGLAGQSGSSTS